MCDKQTNKQTNFNCDGDRVSVDTYMVGYYYYNTVEVRVQYQHIQTINISSIHLDYLIKFGISKWSIFNSESDDKQ